MKKRKPNTYKKIALVLSLAALVVWGILGTGVSLAWFTDTSNRVTNIFHVAEFDLEVSHRTEDGWQQVDALTPVFDENALYEPGYTQVVYLKVENKGTIAFDFYTAVSVLGSTTATNVFGQEFLLHEYLKFGVAIAESEAEMDEAVADREKATAIADRRLQNYATDVAALAPGDSAYIALVVRMPKEVANEANYRGDVIPKVDLGIIVKADQQK